MTFPPFPPFPAYAMYATRGRGGNMRGGRGEQFGGWQWGWGGQAASGGPAWQGVAGRGVGPAGDYNGWGRGGGGPPHQGRGAGNWGGQGGRGGGGGQRQHQGGAKQR